MLPIVEYVQEKVLRVFTFGSPPVSMLAETAPEKTDQGVRSNADAVEPAKSSQPKKDSDPFSLEGLMEIGGGMLTTEKRFDDSQTQVGDGHYHCSVLEALGLSADLVYGYVQPWVSNVISSPWNRRPQSYYCLDPDKGGSMLSLPFSLNLPRNVGSRHTALLLHRRPIPPRGRPGRGRQDPLVVGSH